MNKGDPPPQPNPPPVDPPKNPPKVEPPVPLEVKDIVVPEGFQADDKLTGEFVTVLNDASLDRKALATKLMDLYARTVKTASEKGSEVVTKQMQNWQTETQNDPEVGGAKLPESLGNIAKLMDQFGGKKPADGAKRDAAALRKAFDDTGAGNHPEIVRFLANIASQLVSEGKILPGGNPAAIVDRDAAKILYDHK